jgi:hypothetical protein
LGKENTLRVSENLLRGTFEPKREIVLSPLVKRPGCDVDHLPPSSVEVRNAWSFTFVPLYVYIAETGKTSTLRDKKQEESETNCVVKGFMICTLYQIEFGCTYQVECAGRGVQHAWEGEMPTQFIVIVSYILQPNRLILKPHFRASCDSSCVRDMTT